MCVFVVRERDELMEQLSLLKARYEEVKQREEVSYQQVKTSVQMVEQAELEQMQVQTLTSVLLRLLIYVSKQFSRHPVNLRVFVYVCFSVLLRLLIYLLNPCAAELFQTIFPSFEAGIAKAISSSK